MTGNRQCMIVDLDDDPQAIDLYRQWHRPGGPPAEVIAAIRASGIEEMEIFLSGNRLVMIIDVAPDFDPSARSRADADNEAVQEWEGRMDRFQRPVPWATAGRKWTPAASIFRLTDQP
jgi:L-rhamnose mutarotase